MSFALAIYYFLPFVRWNRGVGAPDQAVLLDFAHSRFYFFFIELWPQEVYYFTGLLILASLFLFLLNAVAGRVWCGYCAADGLDRLFFASTRGRRRPARPDPRTRRLDAEKIRKLGAKHSLWMMVGWWTGGAWVLYFSDAPTLVRNWRPCRPRSPPTPGSASSPSPPIISRASCASRSASTCALGRASRRR